MTFIKAGGSIKGVERELGISYPTVRSRLEELQRLLGFTASAGTRESAREVLDMLERGEITPEDAEDILKNR
jgi:hypothetical protein